MGCGRILLRATKIGSIDETSASADQMVIVLPHLLHRTKPCFVTFTPTNV